MICAKTHNTLIHSHSFTPAAVAAAAVAAIAAFAIPAVAALLAFAVIVAANFWFVL